MPLAAPVAFPLFPINDGKCGCGKEDCSRVGKHPAIKWRELKLGDTVPLPVEGAGFGLKTGAAPKGSGIVVVDLDGPEAFESWVSLGGFEDETYAIETPRGVHLYFQHPGFPVGNSAGTLAKGIDIRGDGGFVVGVSSPHRSGKAYELACDANPAPLPTWLLAWLQARPAPVEVQAYPGDVTDPIEHAYRRDLFEHACKTYPPSIEGQKGDGALWRLVQYGAADLALPTEDLIEVAREHFDPRCVPPWGAELDQRIKHKAHDAKTKSTRPRREPPPADLGPMFNGKKSEPQTPSVSAAATPRAFVGVRASRLAEPLPPIVYVVQHFGIAQGRPALFAGYGGLGKTIIAQALALHLAAGLPTCWGLPITPGPVWHFDYEMTQDPLQRRYQRLAVGYGIDLASCDLHLCSMPSVYLSDDDAEAEMCRATEGVRFAIIDNLAAACATAKMGENESGIRRYLDRLTRVTSRTGCAFMVLAHERKGSKEDDGASALQRVRGSSAITDACGSVISIVGDKKTGMLTLEQNKSSLRRKGDEVVLKVQDVVAEGFMAKEGDDSPGLVIERVNATQRDKEVQEREERLLRAKVDDFKKRLLDEVTKRVRAGAPGVPKSALLSFVSGDNSPKYSALNELLMEGDLFAIGKPIMIVPKVV